MQLQLAIYSTHGFDREPLNQALALLCTPIWLEQELRLETVALAKGCKAIAIFTNDIADAPVLHALKEQGIEWLLLRSAGYNHVDLDTAKALGMRVARVPAYAPEAIAEHALTLALALNRHLPEAIVRTARYNFNLDGLTGRNMADLTVGVVGLGKTGRAFAKLAVAFGSKVLAADTVPDKDWAKQNQVEMTDFAHLMSTSDIVSLHVPAALSTRHIVNTEVLATVKPNLILINTARGEVIDTYALLTALERGKIAAAGLDVHEFEKGLFFFDHSGQPCPEATIGRLLAQPRVIITAHQAFLTQEALQSIAETTADNLRNWLYDKPCPNELT